MKTGLPQERKMNKRLTMEWLISDRINLVHDLHEARKLAARYYCKMKRLEYDIANLEHDLAMQRPRMDFTQRRSIEDMIAYYSKSGNRRERRLAGKLAYLLAIVDEMAARLNNA